MLSLPLKQPATIPYSPVTTAMVYLTEDCNLRCGYCFVKKQPRRMSRETASRVVDFVFRGDVTGLQRVVQVNFFGGEPFLELDRMEEIVEGCRQRPRVLPRSIQFSATTNGTLFGPRIRELVRSSRMAILLSMDGGRPVTAADRPFVSGRSSYETVAENLPRFLEASPDVTVRATFHPTSLKLVERVRELLSLGAPRIVLSPVLELPWEGHEEELGQAYLELAEWYLSNSGPDRVPQLEVTNDLLLQWHQAMQGAPRPKRGCEVGRSLVGIDPDGNVMPCHRFLYRPQDRLGTVEVPELRSERRRPYLELEASRLPDCATCAAEPICGGGCRVVALEKGRGLEGGYASHCLTMRAHRKAVQHIYQGLEERGWLSAALRQQNEPRYQPR